MINNAKRLYKMVKDFFSNYKPSYYNIFNYYHYLDILQRQNLLYAHTYNDFYYCIINKDFILSAKA